MTPHCPTCRCNPPTLSYGPVGDPDSANPFEWLQARAPEGWHIEGQYLGFWQATSVQRDRLRSNTKQGLVNEMAKAGPRR